MRKRKKAESKKIHKFNKIEKGKTKEFWSSVKLSITKYFMILKELIIFRNYKFMSICIYFVMAYFILLSVFLLIKNEGSFILLTVLLSTIISVVILGYIIFLMFDFIPKQIILVHIIPIRDEIKKIYSNAGIDELFELNNYKVEYIRKYIDFNLIPDKSEIEFALFRLKQQRNRYTMLAPLGYLLLYALSACIQSFDSDWVKDAYDYLKNFMKDQSGFINLIKWLFITFLVTDQIVSINSDINRLELLKNLSIKAESIDKIKM